MASLNIVQTFRSDHLVLKKSIMGYKSELDKNNAVLSAAMENLEEAEKIIAREDTTFIGNTIVVPSLDNLPALPSLNNDPFTDAEGAS